MKFVIALATAWFVLSSPAWAAWDQERVTGIAKELAEAINEASQALRKMSPPLPGSSARRAFFNAKDDARALRNSSRHLAASLEEGKGREETLPTYRRIRSVRPLLRSGIPSRCAVASATITCRASRSAACRSSLRATSPS